MSSGPSPDDLVTFQAATMAEALERVRRDLGPEAVIVSHRRIDRRWTLRRTGSSVELLARRGDAPSRLPTCWDAETPFVEAAHVGSSPSPSPPPDVATRGETDPTLAFWRRPAASTSFADHLRPVASAARVVAADDRPVSPPAANDSDGRDRLRPFHAPAPIPTDGDDSADGMASHFGTPVASDGQDSRLQASVPVASPVGRADAGPDAEAAVPRAVLAERLIDRGLNVRVAATLLDNRPMSDSAGTVSKPAVSSGGAIRSLVDPGSLDAEPGTADLIARMAEQIVCREGLAPPNGRPAWVAFLGGTGVGKTTTIAKLAAWQGLGKRLKVGLVTVDTYRVGAVDQLAAYAEVLRLPLEVVTQADQIPAVRRRFADCDWVFVDTAGRSPRDEEPVSQVSRLLSAMPLDETLWVHPVSQGVDAYRHLRAQWPRVRPTGLVLTKLDECPRWGHLWDVLRAGEPPVTYMTDGQNVPQDLLQASQRTVAAALMLGAAAVTGGRPSGRATGASSAPIADGRLVGGRP